MTKTLDAVISRVAALSEEEQDSLANRWLAELEDEHRWHESFAASQDRLAQLAAEALDEHRAGRTEVLDPERL